MIDFLLKHFVDNKFVRIAFTGPVVFAIASFIVLGVVVGIAYVITYYNILGYVLPILFIWTLFAFGTYEITKDM